MTAQDRIVAFEDKVAELAEKYGVNFVLATEDGRPRNKEKTLHSVVSYPPCGIECLHPAACASSIYNQAAETIQQFANRLDADITAGKLA